MYLINLLIISIIGRCSAGGVAAAVTDVRDGVRETRARDAEADCQLYPHADTASRRFVRRTGVLFRAVQVLAL